MADALITRRGGGGGAVENSALLQVISESENIKPNNFVDLSSIDLDLNVYDLSDTAKLDKLGYTGVKILPLSSPDKFLLVYTYKYASDYTVYSQHIYARIITKDGETFSLGTETQVNSTIKANAFLEDVCEIEDGKFLVAYSDRQYYSSSYRFNMFFNVILVSSTSISIGTEISSERSKMYQDDVFDMKKLDSNHVFVAFAQYYSSYSYKNYGFIVSIDGLTLSVGTSTQLNEEFNTSNGSFVLEVKENKACFISSNKTTAGSDINGELKAIFYSVVDSTITKSQVIPLFNSEKNFYSLKGNNMKDSNIFLNMTTRVSSNKLINGFTVIQCDFENETVSSHEINQIQEKNFLEVSSYLTNFSSSETFGCLFCINRDTSGNSRYYRPFYLLEGMNFRLDNNITKLPETGSSSSDNLANVQTLSNTIRIGNNKIYTIAISAYSSKRIALFEIDFENIKVKKAESDILGLSKSVITSSMKGKIIIPK